jgi:hypothetical protein
MSIQKTNHSRWIPHLAQALTAAGGAAPTVTSEWYDCNGQTDKRVSWEVDSGGAIDVDIIAHISPQGYYELNNKTATTDDYEAVTIVEAHTAAIMASIDSSDVDELQRPFASIRFVIDNDSAAAVTGMTVWYEGWS